MMKTTTMLLPASLSCPDQFLSRCPFLAWTGWILLFAPSQLGTVGCRIFTFLPNFFGCHTSEKGDGQRVTLNASNTELLRYAHLENIFTS